MRHISIFALALLVMSACSGAADDAADPPVSSTATSLSVTTAAVPNPPTSVEPATTLATQEPTTTTTSTTTTTVAPTTTTLGPDTRTLALTGYQMAMVGTCVEAAAMISFATTANELWDEQRDELKRAARDRLFDETESAMIGLVAWSEQLHDELLALRASAESGPTSAVMELAAARMEDSAEAMLNGLLLPRSAEDEPGTARRLALDAFVAAAQELDEAAASSIGAQPGLSPYEFEIAALRLEAAGLRHTADQVNSLWDRDALTYRHTTIHLENLADATASLLSRIELATPPPRRTDIHAGLRSAAIDLNRGAQAMLAGLLVPSEDEDLPGTMRHQALDEFRTAAAAVDRAASLALGVPEQEWSPLVVGPGPHTSPPDVIAPLFEITKPVSGAGVGTRSVTVEGTSEPHASIVIGDKTTYADEGGNWSVKIRLDRGHNSFSATATDLAGNETVAEYELHRGYLLSGTRIGGVRLHDDIGKVFGWFTDTFGEPDDTEVIEVAEPDDPYGFWVESYLLFVSWDSPDVFLVIIDDELVLWSTDSPSFVTPEGIHVGSTLEELEAAYGNDLTIAIDAEYCHDDGDFWAGPDGNDPPLYGHLTGPPFTSQSVVTYLGGGWGWPC